MKGSMQLNAVLGIALLAGTCAVQAQEGKKVYDEKCAVCHATGTAGAPKTGNAGDWGPRLKAGKDALYASAIKGTAKGMPPKGGFADLSDAAVKAAVDVMIAGVK